LPPLLQAKATGEAQGEAQGEAIVAPYFYASSNSNTLDLELKLILPCLVSLVTFFFCMFKTNLSLFSYFL
jgi:hypothetical protein